jgi:hypothetical protein
MALQFEYIFTGEGMGGGKEQRNALIKDGTVASAEREVVGAAWRRTVAEHGERYPGSGRSGDADDADAATPGGRGNGGDGVYRS